MENKPIRIQRKRTKGWRMPPNTIYVGRPTEFGNPYDWREYGREQSVSIYKEEKEKHAHRELIRLLLKGKNLCCWCPLDQPCHADILLKIANE